MAFQVGQVKRELLIREIEKTKEIQKEALRKLYLEDLFAFNREVLGVERGTAEGAAKVQLAPFHQELCQFVESGGKKKLILLPRGHLKSTLVTVGYSLQQIAKNPNIRILIVNATYPMAIQFLGQIKRHLQHNQRFIELFGDLTAGASKWRDDMIRVFKKEEEESHGGKEPTVTAWGLGGSLVSQHYDLVILDDLVVRLNVGTKEQIEKVILSYKDVLDLLEPHGKLLALGTRWHDIDLYGWLLSQKEEFGLDVLIKKAVTNNDLETGEILWPEKYDREHLKALRREKGPYEFSSQYLNECVPDESATFRRDWFKTYTEAELGGVPQNLFTFIDPALSSSQDADFTAIVTIGVTKNWDIYIRDILRRRLSPLELIDKMFEVYEEFQPLDMFIEEVAFQKTIRPYTEQEMRRRGVFLPLKEVKPGHGESKELRIRNLQPYFERGQVFFNPSLENTDHLIDELTRFPRGVHDDIIDALAYAPENIFAPKKNLKKVKRKNKYLYA